MKIASGLLVKLEYELAIEGGDVLESSEKMGPLQYEHGSGKMLPGLEKRLEGLSEGDEKEGVIPADEAYGAADQGLPTTMIDRAEFPKEVKLEEGTRFEAKGPEGNPVTLQVMGIDDGQVTVCFIHPLADKSIRFKIKVLDVSDPTIPPPLPTDSK
jgi:FKBP-type peptidyl-prolyl cis-trans isomerase SlyD